MDYRHFISADTQFYPLQDSFRLESGAILNGVQVAYRTWGRLNSTRDNAVLVCHALTGSADVDRWWELLLGSGRSLDPDLDFVVCSNILGSCYGTTGPTSINPETGVAYGTTFPAITIRDMVRLQAVLLEALGVRSLQLVVGGSLGGMQVLEWALLYPNRVQAIAVIGTSGRHSAWCIGLSEAQRQAIFADPNWQNGDYKPNQTPDRGLAIARMMAMSTYRSWASFSARFGRQMQTRETRQQFAIVDYLHHQGRKLVERFDANTYITLTHALDSHDVTRPGQTYETVLQSISQPTLVVSISSDILYPPAEQEELANLIPNAELRQLDSPHGHDAFLIETATINDLLIQFRNKLQLPVLTAIP
ncbi:homoserine O-acetyltransferase (plasmid) [Kovacikia minuta CCNUW1]|uniref:homoserine O-acetyltransferase MetX n=1 Tax=Kovacikia minuta TaxID=2931930 RepID=UPI001CCFE3C9|nr:homoserine O-acetyltransferase [Kovacikia minuta]UBF30334.1 homoserine O-acetyltransferase [Kovacikia minuta CCNUW1]